MKQSLELWWSDYCAWDLCMGTYIHAQEENSGHFPTSPVSLKDDRNSSSQVNLMKTTDCAWWHINNFLQVFRHNLRIPKLPTVGIITDG